MELENMKNNYNNMENEYLNKIKILEEENE
jgi:hypothetical protein